MDGFYIPLFPDHQVVHQDLFDQVYQHYPASLFHQYHQGLPIDEIKKGLTLGAVLIFLLIIAIKTLKIFHSFLTRVQ